MLSVRRIWALNHSEAPGFCAVLKAPWRIAEIPIDSRLFEEKPPDPAAGHPPPGLAEGRADCYALLGRQYKSR